MGKPVLSEENIRLNVPRCSKEEIIKLAGKVLTENGYVQPEYIDSMMEREKAVCTYIGNYVGIPHGICKSEEMILHSGLSLLQVPEGIDYDGETAYVVIGIAGKGDEHLEMLGKLALTCSDVDKVLKIAHASTKKEILDILETVEI